MILVSKKSQLTHVSRTVNVRRDSTSMLSSGSSNTTQSAHAPTSMTPALPSRKAPYAGLMVKPSSASCIVIVSAGYHPILPPAGSSPVRGLRRVMAAYMPSNTFAGSTGKSLPSTGRRGRSDRIRYASVSVLNAPNLFSAYPMSDVACVGWIEGIMPKSAIRR
jgi:hypothetical protein